MELIIDIPEEKYKDIVNMAEEILDASTFCSPRYLYKAVLNGTPLPKGHGGLITKEQAIELVEFYQINPQHFDFVNLIDDIKDEKPIIEADRAESEGDAE